MMHEAGLTVKDTVMQHCDGKIYLDQHYVI